MNGKTYEKGTEILKLFMYMDNDTIELLQKFVLSYKELLDSLILETEERGMLRDASLLHQYYGELLEFEANFDDELDKKEEMISTSNLRK